MKRFLSFVVIFTTLLATALLATSTVFAGPQKKPAAVLTGLVLGPNDKPVARAAITYQSSNGSAPHAVYTDIHGHFTITKLAADNYDVRASANGIFSEWEKNVTLHAGQTRSVTLHLIYAKQMPKQGAIAASNNQ
jgi:Carboxypeptidase regulatory-like domain